MCIADTFVYNVATANSLQFLTSLATFLANLFTRRSGRTYYEKFFGSDLEQGDAMGTAVDVDDEAGIMVVGAPLAVFNVSYENTLYNRCGSAYIFNRTSGMWAQDQILTPGGYAAEGAEFGTAVAVDKPYGREDVTVVVGAPGLAKVRGCEKRSDELRRRVYGVS